MCKGCASCIKIGRCIQERRFFSLRFLFANIVKVLVLLTFSSFCVCFNHFMLNKSRFYCNIYCNIYKFELEADCVFSLCVVSKSVFERFKNIVPFYQNVLKEGESLAV